jgi:NitT/TauT family transport system permease protein
MVDRIPAVPHDKAHDVDPDAPSSMSTMERWAASSEMATAETAAISPASRTGKRWRFSLGDRGSRIASLLSPVLILVAWELAVAVGITDGRFFPPPSQIAGTFWELATNGELAQALGVSLVRILGGFALGAIPGLIIGLTMGLFKPVRMILRPIVSATYPIPKLALMPLIILMFGFGWQQKVITIALGTFFMVLINTMAGVLNLDKIYLDVAKNFGASRKDYYLKVALPGALPLIFTGLELGMGMALLLIVAAEMIGTQTGIGYMIWEAQAIFNVKAMYVAFIVISILGYTFAEGLAAIQRKVIPWKQ